MSVDAENQANAINQKIKKHESFESTTTLTVPKGPVTRKVSMSSELNFDSELSSRCPSRTPSRMPSRRDSHIGFPTYTTDVSGYNGVSKSTSKTLTPNMSCTTPNVSTFQPVKYLSCEDSLGIVNPHYADRSYSTKLSRSASATLCDSNTMSSRNYTGIYILNIKSLY